MAGRAMAPRIVRAPARCVQENPRARGRRGRMFFFEKKKQKTFVDPGSTENT
jgi:hypothetical protein